MILGDVEEVVTTVEIDDETYEEIVRVCLPFFFGIFFPSFSDTQLLHLSPLSIQTNGVNFDIVIK
jgi:hypothetical protein